MWTICTIWGTGAEENEKNKENITPQMWSRDGRKNRRCNANQMLVVICHLLAFTKGNQTALLGGSHLLLAEETWSAFLSHFLNLEWPLFRLFLWRKEIGHRDSPALLPLLSCVSYCLQTHLYTSPPGALTIALHPRVLYQSFLFFLSLC